MELIKDGVKVEWVRLGEGLSGDYDPGDPTDIELLVIFGKPAERELSALMALDIFYSKFSPHEPDDDLVFTVVDPVTGDVLEEDEDIYIGYSEEHRGSIERVG